MAENEYSKFRFQWGPKIFKFELMGVNKYKKPKSRLSAENAENHTIVRVGDRRLADGM